MAVYVMIPVKKDTKAMIDRRKKELGLKTYDETLQKVFKRNVIEALEPFEGTLAGGPKFVRDHLERKIDFD